MNDQTPQSQPEEKPVLLFCTGCGVALVTKRARKTGLCIVCMEKKLSVTLDKVEVPARLKWQN